MTDLLPILHPPTIINAYLKDKIGGYFDNGTDPYDLVFFPTGPTNIDDLTENFPDAPNSVFAVYDRMFRLRRQAFPHVKQEQLLYYFYKKYDKMKELIETIQLVQELLDRGDESAQEVNEWVKQRWSNPPSPLTPKLTASKTNLVTGEDEVFNVIDISGEYFLLPYFHDFRIFQLEEARDIIAFGTARTWAGNKLIINYDYHHPVPN